MFTNEYAIRNYTKLLSQEYIYMLCILTVENNSYGFFTTFLLIEIKNPAFTEIENLLSVINI
jgi:hypothetical protein